MLKKKEDKNKSKADKVKINYSELSMEELKKAEEDLRKELYEMRVKTKVSSLADNSKINKNKKNIARILTVLRQRALHERK